MIDSLVLLLAVVLGGLASSIPWYFAHRQVSSRLGSVEDQREIAETRLFLRVRELENALMSHSWEQYAALQSVPSSATEATDSFGKAKTDEAYGADPEDIVERWFQEHGVDMEGPTVG